MRVIPLESPERGEPRCVVLLSLDRGKLGSDDDLAMVPGVTFTRNGNVIKRVRLARFYMREYNTWLEWYAAGLDGNWTRGLGDGDTMREWEVKLDGLGEHVLCQWNRERYWGGSLKYRMSEVIQEDAPTALLQELVGRQR